MHGVFAINFAKIQKNSFWHFLLTKIDYTRHIHTNVTEYIIRRHSVASD